MNDITIGISGCGCAGQGHLTAFLNAGGQRAFITDPRTEAAQSLAKTHGAEVAGSFDDLIANPAIDLIIIAAPNHLHAQQAIASLNAGKHVLLEKPIALNRADAEAVVEAAERNGRILHVGFELRHSTFPILVKELIANGEIGPLISAHVNHYRGHFQPEWKGRAATGGSLFLMEDCHAIDLFRWWSESEVSKIHAIGTRKNVVNTYDYPDTHFATFIFENGFVAHINDCHVRSAIPEDKDRILDPENGHQYEYSLVGENGSLHFLPIQQICRIYRHELQPGGEVFQKLTRTVRFDTFAEAIHNGEGQMAAFLAYLRGERDALIEPRDALQTHLVCFAGEEALASEQAVTPPITFERHRQTAAV